MRWTYRRFLREKIKPSGDEYFDGVPYVLYTKGKEIEKLDDVSGKEEFLYDEKRIEEIVYNEAVDYIERFSKTKYNKGVYMLCFYVDSNFGVITPIINTESCFDEKNYLTKVTYEEVYGVMGAKYTHYHLWMYYKDDFSSEFDELMKAYYCLSTKSEIDSIKNTYIFPTNIFDNTLELITFRVLKRLEPELTKLNKTKNFIKYMTKYDDIHSDIKFIMKELNGEEHFYECFPEEKAYDRMFQQMMCNIDKETIREQIDFWLKVYIGDAGIKLWDIHIDEEEIVSILLKKENEIFPEIFVIIGDYIKQKIYTNYSEIHQSSIELFFEALLLDAKIDKKYKLGYLEKMYCELKDYQKSYILSEIVDILGYNKE